MNERDSCDDVARAALAWYRGIPDQIPTLLSVSENTTYRLDGGSRSWALRVHRDEYLSENQIESELIWSQSLQNAGVIATAAVLVSDRGNRVERVVTADGLRARQCVIFDWLQGAEPAEDAIIEHFAEVGAISARMHRFSRAWTPPVGFDRPTWNFDTMLGSTPRWGRWQDGHDVDGPTMSLFARTVETIRQRLDQYGTNQGRFGLIHADMRLANLLVTAATTSVIDFDDCGFGWYMYDLAAALSFIEDRSDVGEAVEQWITGYREIAPLADVDIDIIPTMIMMRRLLLVAWLGSRPTADVGPDRRGSFTETTCALADRYLRHQGQTA